MEGDCQNEHICGTMKIHIVPCRLDYDHCILHFLYTLQLSKPNKFLTTAEVSQVKQEGMAQQEQAQAIAQRTSSEETKGIPSNSVGQLGGSWVYSKTAI